MKREQKRKEKEREDKRREKKRERIDREREEGGGKREKNKEGKKEEKDKKDNYICMHLTSNKTQRRQPLPASSTVAEGATCRPAGTANSPAKCRDPTWRKRTEIRIKKQTEIRTSKKWT